MKKITENICFSLSLYQYSTAFKKNNAYDYCEYVIHISLNNYHVHLFFKKYLHDIFSLDLMRSFTKRNHLKQFFEEVLHVSGTGLSFSKIKN